MKNCIVFSFYIGMALIAALVGNGSRVFGQNGALANIPFPFEANDQVLPPGDYRVRVLTPHLISLTDRSTGIYKALLLVHPEQEQKVETRGRMIFLHGEKQYFLAQIRFEGFNVHANLTVKPSLQRELANRYPSAESIVEVATNSTQKTE